MIQILGLIVVAGLVATLIVMRKREKAGGSKAGVSKTKSTSRI